MNKQVLVRLALGLMVFLAGCSTLETANPEVTQQALPLAGQPTGVWLPYEGEDDTECANGSDFEYYALKGKVNKLVIDFQGGGACWEGGTCSLPSSENEDFYLYRDEVSDADLVAAQGIYNLTRDDNPIKDWYHVYIPYCTGDIHIGNAVREYTSPTGERYTVRHKGAVNAASVLNWTFQNFTDPEQIFITGCSAGAYGAAYWTRTIKANYPDMDVKQLGDCGAGVSTDEFSDVLESTWNTKATFPDLTFDASAVARTYIKTSRAYPDSLRMAQYNSLFDNIQILFYVIGSEKPLSIITNYEWSFIMQTSLAVTEALTDNFSFYISALDENDTPSDGTAHCIITREAFYDVETDGVKFVDWLTNYLEGDEVKNVVASR